MTLQTIRHLWESDPDFQEVIDRLTEAQPRVSSLILSYDPDVIDSSYSQEVDALSDLYSDTQSDIYDSLKGIDYANESVLVSALSSIKVDEKKYSALLGAAVFSAFFMSANNVSNSLAKYQGATSEDGFVSNALSYIQDRFYAKGVIKNIIDNYKTSWRKIILKDYEAGISWQDTLDKFKAKLKDKELIDYQIERVVRSDLANASNYAAKQAAITSGVELEAYLIVSRPCDNCAEIATRNPYELNDPIVGGIIHPNCKCAWGYKTL